MTKIWEVNFTNFSGVSNVAYDEVGTQHLTASSGIVKLPLLTSFSYRPGVAFTNNNTVQVYGCRSSGATNACFMQSFNRRSWVMWVYLPAALTNATFFDTGTENCFWGEYTGLQGEAGFFRGTGSILRAKTAFSTAIDYSGSLNVGWNLLIFTCDKILLESAFYVNNKLVGNSTLVTSNTAGVFDCIIGDRSTTTEASFQVGLCSVYDHILTSLERLAIYDSFIKDSAFGGTPFQTFSGTLYGNDGMPLPSTAHYAIYQPTGSIVSSGLTTSSGTYQMDLPYSGAYTALFTSSPSPGSRAFPVIATPTGVYFL